MPQRVDDAKIPVQTSNYNQLKEEKNIPNRVNRLENLYILNFHFVVIWATIEK